MSIIVNELRALVSNMSRSYTITSCIDLGSGKYKLLTDNTYWLRPDKPIVIDGLNYQIDSFALNEWIVVKGNIKPVVTSFEIYKPFFKNGTPRATNNELIQIEDSVDKTPFIWLLEINRERIVVDELSPVESENSLRLFFLDQTNFEDYNTGDHYVNVIEPMTNLVEEFIIELGKYSKFDEVKEYVKINWAKFGVFVTDNGVERKILNDFLSGIEVQLDLTLLKKNVC